MKVTLDVIQEILNAHSACPKYILQLTIHSIGFPKDSPTPSTITSNSIFQEGLNNTNILEQILNDEETYIISEPAQKRQHMTETPVIIHQDRSTVDASTNTNIYNQPTLNNNQSLLDALAEMTKAITNSFESNSRAVRCL